MSGVNRAKEAQKEKKRVSQSYKKRYFGTSEMNIFICYHCEKKFESWEDEEFYHDCHGRITCPACQEQIDEDMYFEDMEEKMWIRHINNTQPNYPK